ncbi:hypothetical protein HPB47_012365 [Ixodes persulcatus]|uniref:Uncharacterized protein n=1 Tax=Ixodes persulcatus TaxID=34615 RepID=A0AC60NTS1_IXOPE|nr:hypothetical protein HPB47_012365 [Ixodes persulcatus]
MGGCPRELPAAGVCEPHATSAPQQAPGVGARGHGGGTRRNGLSLGPALYHVTEASEMRASLMEGRRFIFGADGIVGEYSGSTAQREGGLGPFLGQVLLWASDGHHPTRSLTDAPLGTRLVVGLIPGDKLRVVAVFFALW